MFSLVTLVQCARELLEPAGRVGGTVRSVAEGAGDLGDRREQEWHAVLLQSRRSQAGEHQECPRSCGAQEHAVAWGLSIRNGVGKGVPG